MTYFARFSRIRGELFRFDTRIYLRGGSPELASECVGAVVGANPGSAQPRAGALDQHHELELGNDKMLPYVRNRFNAAFEIAGINVPAGAYVQVLNVFYLCDADMGRAIDKVRAMSDAPICTSEERRFPLVWYAWGAESETLAPLKNRFIKRQDEQSIYMQRDRKSFGKAPPGPREFAKHPRGMPSAPIEQEISSCLKCQVA